MTSIITRGIAIQSEAGTDRQSCAFPQVTVLPSGRWLVGCRAACTKGDKAGQHVMIAASDDEGKSWRLDPMPFIAPALEGKPAQFRAIGLTPLGGDRVLATLYWVDNTDPSLPFFNEQTEGLLDSRIMLAESKDNGATWTTPELVNASPFNSPIAMTGPVLRLPDGEWVCHFETNKPYYDTTKWVHSSVMVFSKDEGKSWPRYAVVTRDPRIFYWDQRPQVLPDGRIFDLFWTYDNGDAVYLNIHARESSDGGRTWSELWDTGVPGQPAPIAALPDGRLAMVYVDRTAEPTIMMRLSSDGGRTWPEQTQSALYAAALPTQTEEKQGMNDAWSEMGKFSVGLPATAALPGGDILVVYYAGLATDTTSIEWVRVRPE